MKSKVPKCKECEFHRFYAPAEELSYMMQNYHWCSEPSVKANMIMNVNRQILAKEAKTSPKWCPKRLNK